MTGRSVGRVIKAHGLRGEVAVEILTSVPEVRFAPGSRLVTPDGAALTVTSTRPHAGKVLVTFAEIGDRTSAEALVGRELEGEGPAEPPPDEIWVHDIEGYRVESVTGEVLGHVIDVVDNPAHDLLVVASSQAEVLVPVVDEFVVTIDEDEGLVVLDPPEGLFG